MTEQQISNAGQISEDGNWIWNGAEWIPNQPAQTLPPGKKNGTTKKVLIGGGVVLALLMVGAAMGSDESSDVPSNDKQNEAPSNPGEKPAQPDSSNPGIGEPARDGKFEFVVSDVREGGTYLGGDYLGSEAQGRFVLVDVTVTNIGNEAQTLFGDNNVLLDNRGREFSFDSEAALYEDDSAWIEEINPGNSVTVTMPFDVPAKVNPTEIRLHDSMLSDGIVVNLK